MNRILTIFTLALLTLLPVKGEDLPKFSITLTVDSAIASQPQQVYLYSQVEREMQLHDSISIDSVHRQGTLHGTVPYEYNVNLMFSRRGPAIVPVVVKNGDEMKIHVGDEDEGFSIRYIDKVEGSPSTLEYVRYYQQMDSISDLNRKVYRQMQRYGITEQEADSLGKIRNKLDMAKERLSLHYANTGKSPYGVLGAAARVYGSHRLNPSMHGYTEKEVDQMMHSVLKRFRDYPPIQAFVNDSVLGRNYMSAESFSINAMLWKRYSRRFFDETEDSIVRPLKVGDYMNVLHLNDYRGQYLYVDFWASWCEPCLQQMPNIKMAAQMFPEDLVVVLVSMDKESKQWWKTVKELDLRSHPKDEHPYEIQNLRAFNDNTGKMVPEVKRLDIRTIPHNYLVDRTGRIIAKNISGNLLIDRMKELLKKEGKQ